MQRFVVLSRGRTASTYFSKNLNRHPDIVMRHELLRHPNSPEIDGRRYDPNIDSWSFLQETLWRDGRWEDKIVGFKLFYFHAGKNQSGTVWQRIERSADIKVVHLSRRNLFSAFVSEQRARQIGLWHPQKSGNRQYLQEVEIEIDLQKLSRYLEVARAQYSYGQHVTESRGGLFVTYEDLKSNSRSAFDRTVEYLGAPEGQVDWASFADGSESRTATRIANMEEVANELDRSDALWMLKPFEDTSTEVL